MTGPPPSPLCRSLGRSLGEIRADVQRIGSRALPFPNEPQAPRTEPPLAYETIIVAYETLEAADDAIRALRRLGVPAHDIRRHPVGADADQVAPVPEAKAPEPGFWRWLFGGELDRARLNGYERALRRGGTIISVRVMEEEAGQVTTLLHRFGPLEIQDLESQE